MADLEQNTLVKDKTLFIIEDDKPFRERLTTSFQRKDFTVTAAASKKEALDVLAGNNFNYAIVDLRLGDGSGLDVIKVIKEQNPECRTVILTSYGNIATAVSSVKLGADDYLTKPFNPRELTIRARNILSRIGQNKVESIESIIKFNQWTLDGNSRQMTSPEGGIVAIPRGEYRALRLLIENAGQIVTRQQLIKEMTGRDLRSNDRTVDVTIRRLRKHFESIEGATEMINTIHGEGYRFIGSVD